MDISIEADSVINLGQDQLCLFIGKGYGKTVYYKSNKLSLFFNPSEKVHHVYVDFFAGSEFEKWKKKDLDFRIFIRKEKNSKYKLVRCNLKQIDYNPSRWLVWE